MELKLYVNANERELGKVGICQLNANKLGVQNGGSITVFNPENQSSKIAVVEIIDTELDFSASISRNIINELGFSGAELILRPAAGGAPAMPTAKPSIAVTDLPITPVPSFQPRSTPAQPQQAQVPQAQPSISQTVSYKPTSTTVQPQQAQVSQAQPPISQTASFQPTSAPKQPSLKTKVQQRSKKKERLRGFPKVIQDTYEVPLKDNEYFQKHFGHVTGRIVLNPIDGNDAAVITVQNGDITVKSIKNKPKTNLSRKYLRWDGIMQTKLQNFLDIAAEKITRKDIILGMLKGKIKIKGRYYVEFLDILRTFMKDLKQFNT